LWPCLAWTLERKLILSRSNKPEVKDSHENMACPLYQAGPARKVTGRRRGMTYTEEDWVDDEATSHRRLEE